MGLFDSDFQYRYLVIGVLAGAIIVASYDFFQYLLMYLLSAQIEPLKTLTAKFVAFSISLGIGAIFLILRFGKNEEKNTEKLKDMKNGNDSNAEIQEKLTALQNLKLNQEGLAIGKDIHNIAKAEMELSTLLFNQLHQNILKLSNSSKRLETFTILLVILTAFLGGVTIIESYQTDNIINRLKDVTEAAFFTENFHTNVTYLGSVPITLEQQNYSNANFIDHLKFSTVSPHYLKFTVLDISLDPINDCDFPKFQKVNMNEPIVIYRDKGVDNTDIQIPFTLDFTALGVQPSHAKINSNNTSILTELRVHANIVDYQTGDAISPNVIFQTDILIHKTYANFCHN